MSVDQKQAIRVFHEKIRDITSFYTEEKMDSLYRNPNALGDRVYSQVNTSGTNKSNLMAMLHAYLSGDGTTAFARLDEVGKSAELEERYANFLFVMKPIVLYLVMKGDSSKSVNWGQMDVPRRTKFSLAVEHILFFYDNGGIPCDLGDVPAEQMRSTKFVPLHLALEHWCGKAYISEVAKNNIRSFVSSSFILCMKGF